MEVTKLFKDALKYPTKDFNKLLILGVLFLITGITSILQLFGNDAVINILVILFGVLSIIIFLIISGYGLSITRKTIALDENIPGFEWGKNLVDGLKIVVLGIVYYIIPFIVTLIVAFLTGAVSHFMEIVNYAIANGITTTTTGVTTTIAPTAIPQALLENAIISFAIVGIIGAILFIIFSLLENIAVARLAETDKLSAAINMKDTFDKIGEIGWGNYIIWIIVLIVITVVISLIFGIVMGILGIVSSIIGGAILFSIISSIISYLLLSPYIQMFSSRALGLLYNESKNN